MQIYVKKILSDWHIFVVFSQDSVIYIDFAHVAHSNTETDDVTN